MSANSQLIDRRQITKKLDTLDISSIAKSTGFYVRKERKISAKALLISFFTIALKGNISFQNWAIQLGILTGQTVSKIALWKKMNSNQVLFLKQILDSSLAKQYSLVNKRLTRSDLFVCFNNVYLHDSTTLHLPDHLNCFYPGNYTKGKQKAVARIQTCYNLKKNLYQFFEVNSFTDNDQSAACSILPLLRPGDLLIRDLGYFVLKAFTKMVNDGVYFLSRFHHGTSIYDLRTKEKICLLSLLKGKTLVDKYVLLGKRHKLKVRLVAIQLSDSLANHRRRKAKMDRDRRLNHSQEYLQLLGWNIIITTVGANQWNAEQVEKAYRIRWGIEILFKCWKSNFNLANLVKDTKMTKIRVESLIYSMLLFITLFQLHIFNYYLGRIYDEKQQFISIVKLSSFIKQQTGLFLNPSGLEVLEPIVSYYCCYEKRSNRMNYMQKVFSLS
jgi:hypothetical protein